MKFDRITAFFRATPAPTKEAAQELEATPEPAAPAPDRNDSPVDWNDPKVISYMQRRDRLTVGGQGPNAGKWRTVDRRKAWQKECTNWSFDKSGTIATPKRKRKA